MRIWHNFKCSLFAQVILPYKVLQIVPTWYFQAVELQLSLEKPIIYLALDANFLLFPIIALMVTQQNSNIEMFL